MTAREFYGNAGFGDEIDYSQPPQVAPFEPEPTAPRQQLWMTARVITQAVAMSGLLLAGPHLLGEASEAKIHTPFASAYALAMSSHPRLQQATLATDVQRRAKRVHQLFHPVPLSASEQRDDPDYGL
jgi:hypothetical protein